MGEAIEFKLSFDDIQPIQDMRLAYLEAVRLINPDDYYLQQNRFYHGDCFGAEMVDIMTSLNGLKRRFKGFDFCIDGHNAENENGLVGVEPYYFFWDGWYYEQTYQAILDSNLFDFLEKKGFQLITENGDHLNIVDSRRKAETLRIMMYRNIKYWTDGIKESIPHIIKRIETKITIRKLNSVNYAVIIGFDFFEIEDSGTY
jgi:hypothetical protein